MMTMPPRIALCIPCLDLVNKAGQNISPPLEVRILNPRCHKLPMFSPRFHAVCDEMEDVKGRHCLSLVSAIYFISLPRASVAYRSQVRLKHMSMKMTPTMMRLTSKFHPTPDGVFPISLTSYGRVAAVLTQACRCLKFPIP